MPHNNLCSATIPLYYVLKLIGLIPFKLEINKTKNSYEHKYSLLNTIVILGCHCGLIVSFIYTFHRNPTLGAQMEVFTDRFQVYIGLAAYIANIFFNCYHQSEILETLEILSVTIKHFESKGLNYNTIYNYTLSSLITVTVLLISILASDVLYFVKGFEFLELLKVLGYVAPFCFNVYTIFTFCEYILVIRYCFRLMNNEIILANRLFYTSFNQQDVADTKQEILFKRLNSDMNQKFSTFEAKLYHVIQSSREYHFKLVELAQELNHYFAIPILLTMLLNFVSLIAQLYYWSEYISFEDKILSFEIMLYTVTFFILISSTIFVLVLTCESTINQSNHTGFLIHQIESPNKDIKMEQLLFSHQLMHQNIKFNACGLFLLNNGLLSSMVGSITTYLVILIQFDKIQNVH